MQQQITATTEARDLVRRLTAQNGALALFQSGGCCDGSLPICLLRGDLEPAVHDLWLGCVEGADFYVDQELYERWGRPLLRLDVRPGAAQGFSLSSPDAHFVTTSEAHASAAAALPLAAGGGV